MYPLLIVPAALPATAAFAGMYDQPYAIVATGRECRKKFAQTEASAQ